MSERRFWFVIDKGKLEYVQDLVTGEKITVSKLEDLLNTICDITLTYPNLVGEIEIGRLLIDMALNGENGKMVLKR